MTEQIKAFVEANKIVSEQGKWADEAWDEFMAYQPTSQEQSVMHQAMIRSSKLVHKATPQSREWVGLSDDEVLRTLVLIQDFSNYKFARAIEAKLKEKNND